MEPLYDKKGTGREKSVFTVKTIAFSGVFAALIFLATMFLKLQTGGTGYVNLGDGVILAAAQLLGPVGFFPAAIGSALADFAGGYIIYIPGTFVIKGLMGLVAGWLLRKKPATLPRFLIVCVISELIMIFGYVIYKSIFITSLAASLADVPHDIGQAVAGVTIAFLFRPTIDKLKKL